MSSSLPLSSLFLLLPDMITMFSSSGYQSNIFDWLFFGSIIDHQDGTKCQCSFSINFMYIFIFYSIFLRFEKQEDYFYYSTSPGHVICFPHLYLLKTVRSVRVPPVCSICLRGPPTRGESSGINYFGLWGDLLTSPWWGRVNRHGQDYSFSKGS